MNTPHAALDTAKEWARERLRSGMEPPWAYYRLMQLIDAIDSLAAGAAAVNPTGCSQRSEAPSDETPQQEGGNIYRLDGARLRHAGQTVIMPM